MLSKQEIFNHVEVYFSYKFVKTIVFNKIYCLITVAFTAPLHIKLNSIVYSSEYFKEKLHK